MPEECIIESLGFVDKNGIQMAHIGDLPLACAATCSASVSVQRMGMVAGVSGDIRLLNQAMLHDPLVGAVCDPEEVWQMTDEMLAAQAEWLPQYSTKGEIEAAEGRIRKHEGNGTRVRTMEGFKGMARVRPRTDVELARLVEERR